MIRIFPGRHRGADASRRIFHRAKRLRRARVLARAGVILDVDGRDAGALEGLHRAPHVRRVVESAFGIGDHRNLHRLDDRARLLDERVEREQARIRHAEAACGGGVAADVNAFEGVRFDELRAERIGGARDGDRAATGDEVAKRSHAGMLIE